MAKFCKYCGAPLEEGQQCTCAESQAAAAQAAAPAAVPAAAPETAPAAPNATAEQAKALLLEAKDILLTYVKAPQAAAQATMNSANHLALAGVFAGANALAALLFIWRLMGQVLGMVTGVAGSLGVDIKYPFFPMLITAIVLTVVFTGMSGLALFVCGKITKREMDIKYAMEIAAVASVLPTALLLVGVILGFIAWQLQVICLVLAGIVWVANGLADLNDYTGLKANASIKDLGVVVLTMLVVAAVCYFATSKLSVWCVGEITVMGQKVSEFLKQGLSGILGGLM